MLVLSRKLDQVLVIGDDVRVKVVGIHRDEVRLAIDAPVETPVHRSEVYQRIKRQPRARAGNVRPGYVASLDRHWGKNVEWIANETADSLQELLTALDQADCRALIGLMKARPRMASLVRQLTQVSIGEATRRMLDAVAANPVPSHPNPSTGA